MIRRHFPTYAAAAFCAVFAAGRAGAQAPAATPGRNSGKEYVLKNVSSFTAPPVESRNPFWPIGWVPAAPVLPTVAAAPVVDVKAEQFTVTSISVDYPPLAVVNGLTKAIGERMAVPGTAEFVTVKKITDGMVVLEYKGHDLNVVPSLPGAVKKEVRQSAECGISERAERADGTGPPCFLSPITASCIPHFPTPPGCPWMSARRKRLIGRNNSDTPAAWDRFERWSWRCANTVKTQFCPSLLRRIRHPLGSFGCPSSHVSGLPSPCHDQ